MNFLHLFIFIVCGVFFFLLEIEMLVDDPKDYEELHEMVLDQELCIHITEDMLTMSPDRTNGFSGSSHSSVQSSMVVCTFVNRDGNILICPLQD